MWFDSAKKGVLKYKHQLVFISCEIMKYRSRRIEVDNVTSALTGMYRKKPCEEWLYKVRFCLILFCRKRICY